MSTDYKIGIVVGLVVLIAGIVYFLTSGDGDKITPPVETAVTETEVVEQVNAPVESASSNAPVEVSLNTLEPQTQPAVTQMPVAEPPTPVETPATQPVVGFHLDEDADDSSAPIETPATEAPQTVRIQVPTESADGFQLSEDADAAYTEPDLESVPVTTIRTITPPAEEATAETLSTAGGTYTVKKGDNGYWTIAQRVYGQENGKYWTLIQKANPTADTNALREGQVLKIPPLPASANRTTAVRPSADTTDSSLRINLNGTTPAVSADGSEEYIVVEGDAGLWGIAEKKYGKGQLWEVIQKANPSVKPGSLRVGMKLVIPPLPSATTPRSTDSTLPSAGQTTTTTSSGSAHPRGELFTENNQQYYIVKAGDMGYWGIAKKVYKDGKYSYLIDRANPGVDALSLQPGDKLVIPPLPAPGETTQPTTSGRTSRPAPRRTTPARRAPAPVRDGEPDFGP